MMVYFLVHILLDCSGKEWPASFMQTGYYAFAILIV